MQKSLLFSSFGHLSILFFMIFSGWELNKKIEPLLDPVEVSVISSLEFDAHLSVAPVKILKKLSSEPEVIEKVILKPQIAADSSAPTLLERPEKIETQFDDKRFTKKNDVERFKVETNNIILTKPKKVKLPTINSLKQTEGNEKNSLSSPKIANPKPRTADRIDKVAVSKSSSEKITELPKKAIKVAPDALEVKEVSDAETPKEASTKITPEGKTNVPVVVSGAIQTSLPPLSRPNVLKQTEEPPIKRPTATILLKKKKQSDQIDMLLAQVELDQQKASPEVSIIEENNMMAAIAQKLAKYWEQGILSGNSNFEKYIVQVEVEVNSLGEIVGVVKPLVPRVPKGRYLIAFRQASNALISAATLPIIPGKYPSGITLKITFDPEKGFSF